ncbi:MAG: helix-turn-helix transcriptional regulator [Ruminococcus sp.]|nr:helix-turn-helix transcriptional regulator [Ruminococcus sp.]
MVKNNIELDVKIKCLEANITQQELGAAIDTTGQYVNRIVKQKKESIINKTFVRMMEALGYDIEMTYVPREEK